jgi:hypothetical protein
MIIKQPEDQSIDRERINGMLILLNYTFDIYEKRASIIDIVRVQNDINKIKGLGGKFTILNNEVVFEAGNS